MPADFARSAGIDTKKTLTLLGLDGSEKEMPVRYDKKRYYCVAKGWPEFRRNNAILAGDKCVFKFITNDDKLCLVTISKKKTPTSPLPPAATKDDDEDDNEDVERVDDEDPFFVATINHKYMLRLPSDFVALAKIDTKEHIIIRSLDGNERQIPMQSYKQFKLTWYHFSIGWPSFRRSNNISKGDECVFKYIRCEDKMCLVKVTKRKTQARSSPPAAVAIETEVDDGLDDKDEDEDADFDDDDDPFFVVTLTQHNFKGCLL
ncbi:DNA-binding pseudobarrel domain-containing protein, partial [Tanacetum coccineum]